MDSARFISFVRENTVFSREVFLIMGYATFFFFLFAFGGYVLSETNPLLVRDTLDEMSDIVDVLIHMSPLYLALFIFANNSITALSSSLGGVLFAVLPALTIAVNGALLGVVFSLTSGSSLFYAGIVPHGVIELPVVLYATALGVWLGWGAVKVVRREEGVVLLKQNIKKVIYTNLCVIFPLLFVAAIIEAYVTPIVLQVFVGMPIR